MWLHVLNHNNLTEYRCIWPYGTLSDSSNRSYLAPTETSEGNTFLLQPIWHRPSSNVLKKYATDRHTISHHDTPRGNTVRALFCPICQIFPVWLQRTIFQRFFYFCFTIVFGNFHPDALHNNSRNNSINLQPYFKIACMKCLLWPTSNSNVVDVSLPSGSLRYWTVCNHGKRYCILRLVHFRFMLLTLDDTVFAKLYVLNKNLIFLIHGKHC